MTSESANISPAGRAELASGVPGRAKLPGPALVCVGLALATLAVYWSVAEHDFVTYDDKDYVTANDHVLSGLKWSNVAWAFQTSQSCSWQPLVWLSHMLDCQLFGVNSAAHHLENVGFHIANTLLLFLGLRRITGALWRSAVVAALFALHPLHVESVAWLAERKDVLSTFFLLLTLGAYGRYVELGKGGAQASGCDVLSSASSRKAVWYLISLGLFALGLMSKPMLVTLPFVLLLLDYWPLQRFKLNVHRWPPNVVSGRPHSLRPLLLEKLPFFALSVAGSVVTFWLQKKEGAMNTMLPADLRISNALVSYARYLGKMVWPKNLAVFYPYPTHWPLPHVLAASLLLLGISALAITLSARRPYLLAGWCWFLGTLVPVIGLVQVGSQSMADRYTYVPSIGLFVMVVWSLSEAVPASPGRNKAFALAAALSLGGLVWITARQLQYWRNTETLWRHTAQATLENFVAYSNLGLYLSDHGKVEEAMEDYRLALRINPAYAEAHNNLGIEMAKQGNLNEAIVHFQEAIRSNPGLAGAHGNLGLSLALEHNPRGAVEEFQESLRLKPDDAAMHSLLGDVLADQGKYKEAIGQYREALRLGLINPKIHLNLGMALERVSQPVEAMVEFGEALRLKPDYAEAQKALRELGSAEEH
jgi:tetratricopeptide (TPR) repeat protein